MGGGDGIRVRGCSRVKQELLAQLGPTIECWLPGLLDGLGILKSLNGGDSLLMADKLEVGGEVDLAGVEGVEGDAEFEAEPGGIEGFAIGDDEADAFDGLLGEVRGLGREARRVDADAR